MKKQLNQHNVALTQLELEPKHQQGFFAWEKVQNRLVSVLTVKTEHCVAEETDDPYYPLSWWDKQGFPAEQVEANGKKRPCPVFGTVYSAPLFRCKQSSRSKFTEKFLSDHMEKQKLQKLRQKSKKKAPGTVLTLPFPPVNTKTRQESPISREDGPIDRYTAPCSVRGLC